MVQPVDELELYTLDLVRGCEPSELSAALEEAVQFALEGPEEGPLPTHLEPDVAPGEAWGALYDESRKTLLLPAPSKLKEAFALHDSTPGSCRSPARNEVHVTVRLTLFPTFWGEDDEAEQAVEDALHAHVAATGYDADAIVLVVPASSADAAGSEDDNDGSRHNVLRRSWAALLRRATSRTSLGVEASNRAELDAFFPPRSSVPLPAFISVPPVTKFCEMDEGLSSWCSERGVRLMAGSSGSDAIPSALDHAAAFLASRLPSYHGWTMCKTSQAKPLWALEVSWLFLWRGGQGALLEGKTGTGKRAAVQLTHGVCPCPTAHCAYSGARSSAQAGLPCAWAPELAGTSGVDRRATLSRGVDACRAGCKAEARREQVSLAAGLHFVMKEERPAYSSNNNSSSNIESSPAPAWGVADGRRTDTDTDTQTHRRKGEVAAVRWFVRGSVFGAGRTPARRATQRGPRT